MIYPFHKHVVPPNRLTHMRCNDHDGYFTQHGVHQEMTLPRLTRREEAMFGAIFLWVGQAQHREDSRMGKRDISHASTMYMTRLSKGSRDARSTGTDQQQRSDHTPVETSLTKVIRPISKAECSDKGVCNHIKTIVWPLANIAQRNGRVHHQQERQ